MSSAQGRQPAIVFITLVLAVVGFGLLIPVLPKVSTAKMTGQN
jgi:hypothetical protein